MKGLLVFVLGLSAGAGVMFVLKPDRSAEATSAERRVKVAAGQLEEAQHAMARARAETAALRQELQATQAAAAKPSEPSPAGPEPVPAPASSEKEGESKKFGEMIKAVGQSQTKAQMDAKIARLKERLKLTPEQEANLTNVITERTAEMWKSLERMFEGNGEPADFGKLVRLQLGTLPEEVEGLLTAEQKIEYDHFKQEERGNRIEMRASAELLGLQGAGGLTPDQKDQAFAQLSEFAATEEDVDWNKIQSADEVRTFFDQSIAKRLDGMRSILTEPQMKTYESQMQMQRDVITRLVPSLASPKEK
ncbi:MAG: hypothetical protein ACR2OZ_12530 [Verrucomicrobiales bacterium]